MAKHTGSCDFQPSKRGVYLACVRISCTERFPCAGNDCGHLDCIEERHKLPKCYWCEKQVAGPRGEAWAPMLVHGHTVAGHYACKEKVA